MTISYFLVNLGDFTQHPVAALLLKSFTEYPDVYFIFYSEDIEVYFQFNEKFTKNNPRAISLYLNPAHPNSIAFPASFTIPSDSFKPAYVFHADEIPNRLYIDACNIQKKIEESARNFLTTLGYNVHAQARTPMPRPQEIKYITRPGRIIKQRINPPDETARRILSQWKMIIEGHKKNSSDAYKEVSREGSLPSLSTTVKPETTLFKPFETSKPRAQTERPTRTALPRISRVNTY